MAGFGGHINFSWKCMLTCRSHEITGEWFEMLWHLWPRCVPHFLLVAEWLNLVGIVYLIVRVLSPTPMAPASFSLIFSLTKVFCFCPGIVESANKLPSSSAREQPRWPNLLKTSRHAYFQKSQSNPSSH